METILIMARALANASKGTIMRLDIQQLYDEYHGYCFIEIEGINVEFRINENGEVTKIDR